MKTFSVNKNSWHYKLNFKMCQTNERLAQGNYAEKYVESKDNFCSYWRMSIWSMFKVLLVIAFVAGATTFIGYMLYLMGYAFVVHTQQAILSTVAVVIIFGLIFGIAYIVSLISERNRKKMNAIIYDGETETSLAKAKYSSWKAGICLPVEFKE